MVRARAVHKSARGKEEDPGVNAAHLLCCACVEGAALPSASMRISSSSRSFSSSPSDHYSGEAKTNIAKEARYK